MSAGATVPTVWRRLPHHAPREELRATLPIGRVVGPADIAALAVHLMTNTAVTSATYDTSTAASGSSNDLLLGEAARCGSVPAMKELRAYHRARERADPDGSVTALFDEEPELSRHNEAMPGERWPLQDGSRAVVR